MTEAPTERLGKRAPRALTLRGLAAGVVSAPAVDILIPLSAYRLSSSRLVFSYLPMGVLTFLTWAIKYTVLKVGGHELYRRSRALFMGLLFGYVGGAGASLAMDVLFFYGEWHRVHHW